MTVGDFNGPGDGVHTKRTGKMDKEVTAGGTVANNTPVGSAGQPQSGIGMFGRRGKQPDEKKSGAIGRRIAMMNKKGKK